MFKDIIILTVIMVFIVDLSGVIDSIKGLITINGRQIKHFKPFDCSLCMTFWSGLAYLLFTHSFDLWGVFAVCMMSFLTPVVKEVLQAVSEALKAIVRLSYKVIDKVD